MAKQKKYNAFFVVCVMVMAVFSLSLITFRKAYSFYYATLPYVRVNAAASDVPRGTANFDIGENVMRALNRLINGAAGYSWVSQPKQILYCDLVSSSCGDANYAITVSATPSTEIISLRPSVSVIYYATNATPNNIYLNENASLMFSGLVNINLIDNIANWNTSKTTNMAYMFNGTNVSSLNLTKWSVNNVTNMAGMFYRTTNLSTLNITGWNTAKLYSINHMFYDTKATTLDVGAWKTNNLVYAEYAFRGFQGTSLNVNAWNTGKLVSAWAMFTWANKITTLNVSQWNTSKLELGGFMFYAMQSLTSLDVSNWNTSCMTSAAAMFNATSSLSTLNVKAWNTSSLTDVSWMFAQTNLRNLNLYSWNTRKIVNTSNMFYNSRNLTWVDFRYCNFSNLTTTTNMFFGLDSINKLRSPIYIKSGTVIQLSRTMYIPRYPSRPTAGALSNSQWNTSSRTSAWYYRYSSDATDPYAE